MSIAMIAESYGLGRDARYRHVILRSGLLGKPGDLAARGLERWWLQWNHDDRPT